MEDHNNNNNKKEPQQQVRHPQTPPRTSPSAIPRTYGSPPAAANYNNHNNTTAASSSPPHCSFMMSNNNNNNNNNTLSRQPTTLNRRPMALPPSIRTTDDLAHSLHRSLSFKSTGSSGTGQGTGLEESGISSVRLLERSPTPEPIARLRGRSTSPAHSFVGSATRVGELTPVTRNTRAVLYVDSSCCSTAVTIPMTPQKDESSTTYEEQQELYNSRQSLFGEHLAIPSNLDDCYSDDEDDDDDVDDADNEADNALPRRLQGPPPVRNRPPLMVPGLPMVTDGPMPPFQLQARKFFSFQSNYNSIDDDLLHGSEDEGDYNNSNDKDNTMNDDSDSYTPYAPSGRPAAFDIETVVDGLDEIFQDRGPIPIEQRIPSLHRAELMYGSTTTMTDGEDSLDGSYSSLGSSILLEGRAKRYQDYLLQQQQQQQSPDSNDMEEDVIVVETRRQERRRKRRQQAREFLASVEGDESCVAEAASSKLLLQRSSPLRRQVSCPQH